MGDLDRKLARGQAEFAADRDDEFVSHRSGHP
jgi:hypothetical protein